MINGVSNSGYYNPRYYGGYNSNPYYSARMYGGLYDNSPIEQIKIPEPKDNTGKIVAGGAVVAGALAAIALAKKGKISGAKKAITDLFTKGKTNIKDIAKKETISKYNTSVKEFFTKGKGQKVWNPVKNAYQYVKGLFTKKDAFANMPKFSAYEYEVGKFNPYV